MVGNCQPPGWQKTSSQEEEKRKKDREGAHVPAHTKGRPHVGSFSDISCPPQPRDALALVQCLKCELQSQALYGHIQALWSWTMLTMSLSQVPCLSNEDHNSTHQMGLLWEFKRNIRVLTHVKHSVNLAAVVFFTWKLKFKEVKELDQSSRTNWWRSQALNTALFGLWSLLCIMQLPGSAKAYMSL